jgi:hypothetical protein
MLKVLIALVAVAVTPGPVVTLDDKADVLATVNQFVNGFNKGDTKSAAAVCAEQTSIIDEFPPHEWHGKGACAKWMADYDKDAKLNAITDGVVTLGTPRHVDVNGTTAYVVIPSDYAFRKKGIPVKETGSMFTFALQKGAAGWRITGWSWAKN